MNGKEAKALNVGSREYILKQELHVAETMVRGRDSRIKKLVTDNEYLSQELENANKIIDVVFEAINRREVMK